MREAGGQGELAIMSAVFTGNGLGLFNTSMSQLGTSL